MAEHRSRSPSAKERRSMLGLRSRGGYYLSIIDSITALCTFREGSFEESSDEEIVPTVEHVRDSGWVDAQKGGAGGVPSLRRPLAGKKAGLVNRSKDPAYFLTLLRSGFPGIWDMIIGGFADTVVCVPQSTSLMQEKLSLIDARAHVLFLSETPGEFVSLDGWRVTIVGNEVVTGRGFPERRRVRLLLSEDLAQYLGHALPLRTRSSKRVVHDGEPATERGVDRISSWSGRDAKSRPATKVIDVRKRTRTVRLLHLSRPLIGGLVSAPENAGELDMAMVDKYTAVLKSYPEMESVFSEMDRFAADVVSYCTRNLSVSQHTGGAASSTAPGRLKHELRMLLSRAGTSARRLLQPTNPPTTPTTPKETQDAFGLTATSTDVVVVGNDDGVSHAGEPVDADGVPANTNGDTDSVRVGTGEAGARARAATAAAGAFARREAVQEQRCQQAELCAVVAEQWRKSAAALARSRCVRSRNGGADAKERREVNLMQVTESYLMVRLTPALSSWIAMRYASADAELERAIGMLRYHTQEDMGVNRHFQCDLTQASAFLKDSVERCMTPMDKMLQVKECLRVIQTSVQTNLERHRRADFEVEEDSCLPAKDRNVKEQGVSSANSPDEPSATTTTTTNDNSIINNNNNNNNGNGGSRSGDNDGFNGSKSSVDCNGQDRKQDSEGGAREYGEGVQLATDDLVLLLVCCVIEASKNRTAKTVNSVNGDANNPDQHGAGSNRGFISDLAFIKSFHFCEDSTSPVAFAMSTLEVALEWLLAKVGLRLGETPATSGLGSFLRVDKRILPSPLPPLLAAHPPPSPPRVLENEAPTAGDVLQQQDAKLHSGSDEVGEGEEWGGDEMSAVPPALCHIALRENIKAELGRHLSPFKGRQRAGKTVGETVKPVAGGGGGGGGGGMLSLDDFQDARGALPWEAPFPDDDDNDGGDDEDEAEEDDNSMGTVEEGGRRGAGRQDSLAVWLSNKTHKDATSEKSTQGASDGGDGRVEAVAERARKGRAGRGGYDRVMVFGDSGSDETVMFQVKGEGENENEDAGQGGRRINGGSPTAEVEVVQVSCGPQYFAAVTRQGGVYTWGLEAEWRLGHGRHRRTNTGGAAGDQAAYLKMPLRVMPLRNDHIVQVSCGAKHVLAATANGHLFAWGDNSRGQCGVMWSSSSSPAVASPSDHSDGDSDSDDWWDDYGGRGGVGSADLKKLQGAGADGQQDGPGGKKGVDIFDGEGESATSGKAVGGSWGGSRDGGQERHGEHGGYGPRVVRRPTVVYLWESSATSKRGIGAGRGAQRSKIPPLWVLQVACGRQHSLALACPRRASNQHSNGDRNMLYSWGRAGCGRLGRSSEDDSAPAPPLSASKAPSLRALLRGGSERLLSSAEGRGGAGGSLRKRSSKKLVLSSASAAGERDKAELPECYLPAEVIADWSYRVNDHTTQEAALVLARPPPGFFAPTTRASSPDSAMTTQTQGGVSTPMADSVDEATETLSNNPVRDSAAAPRAAVGRRGGRAFRGGRGPVSIAAGWRHSIAVTGEGAAFVWGCGSSGRLGLGSHCDVHEPQQVRALASRAIRIRQAAAGRAHTLFLSDSGTVFACGSNTLGQCGGAGSGTDVRSSTADSHVLAPRVVGGNSALCALTVERVDAGDDHSAAVTAAYGDAGINEQFLRNDHFTTGDSTGGRTASLSGGSGAGGVEGQSNRGSHGSDGSGATSWVGNAGDKGRSRVFTWGLNKARQCAQGRATEVIWLPQEAELLSGARAVGCGAGHTLVVL